MITKIGEMTGFGCHVMVRRSDGGDGGFRGAAGGRAVLPRAEVVAGGGHGCVRVEWLSGCRLPVGLPSRKERMRKCYGALCYDWFH